MIWRKRKLGIIKQRRKENKEGVPKKNKGISRNQTLH